MVIKRGLIISFAYVRLLTNSPTTFRTALHEAFLHRTSIYSTSCEYLGLEDLTAVVMNIAIFWDTVLCNIPEDGNIHSEYFFVDFEVLTMVVMKSYEKLKNYISRNIMLYRPLKVNIFFRGTCFLHLQGKRISQAGGKQNLLSDTHWFPACLPLFP
jgi:hypothetical protein